MKNDILFIGATHGDETIGVRALETLEQQRDDFDWIIGNEKAYKKNARTFTADLNRSAPGNLVSATYEKRRAAEIIDRSKQYTYTIDLHGTYNNTGIFLIVTNPSEENMRLASMFDIDKIVIWPSITPEMQYPPSEFFSCGLEIECGNQENLETQGKLEKILNTFLDSYKQKEKGGWEKRLDQKQIYKMYGPLPRNPDTEKLPLREFEEVKYEGETFTPVFISTYDYEDVLCYKLKKLS